MRIALVVQRYGPEVAGGAELHARYVAELLRGRHAVTVLTTTARDYVSWTPAYPAGRSELDGVEVLRFPVERPRDPERFARACARAFEPGHGLADERLFLEEQGPYAPALWGHLRDRASGYDAVIAFSYRYITTQEAARVRPGRTLLVPTAERDPVVGLQVSRELFRSVGALAFNTPEEREMILESCGVPSLAGEVVGVFSRIPSKPQPGRFRARHRVEGPYVLYVGRIDRNKGCPELFRFWTSFVAETALPHRLLLLGEPVLELPLHPRIRHLGFLADEDKFDAIAGAEVLVLPSPYESLSMVTLEAMALGVPPLVNGACDVLRGQIRRSHAGLYYRGYEEFFETLYLLLGEPRLRALLGRKGRAFYQASYAETVVGEKYERLLASLVA